MKKLSILFLAFIGLLFIGMYSAPSMYANSQEYIETFETSELTSSYASGSFNGLFGIQWTYSNARNVGTYPIDAEGLMFGSTSGKLESSIIEGGIDSISVDARKAFTGGSNNRKIKIEVIDENETVIESLTSDTFGSSDTDEKVHTFTISDIQHFGKFKLVISQAGAQVTLDNIKWTSPQAGIKATINQLFGVENSIPVTIDAVEYGQDITIPIAQSSGENNYRFAVINGVVNSEFKSNITMPITDGLDVSLVYASESKHAVLFVDSNGKLISHSWVNNGEDVIAPEIVNISKPGYIISEIPWLSNEGSSSLEGINSSRVYTLQYTLNQNPVQVTVNGGTPIEYAYNEIVTITATNLENFKAWMENGKVVSTNPTYTFTALTDRVLVESTDAALVENKVVLSGDLKLRSGYQTFVGQLSLGENEVLVEYGLVVTNNGLLKDEELTLSNATKVKSDILNPATNEFMLSIGEEYLVVRAYVVVRDAEDNIETYYSDYQYSDVILVSFDTDGGNEIPTIIVKTNAKVTEPVEPTRGEDIFLGWYEDEEFTMEYNFNTLLIEDITLYAKWEIIQPAFETVIMSYSGTTSTNMTENNNAEEVGLDESLFNVKSSGGNPNIGLNKDGEIRIYANQTLIVELLNSGKITKIEIVFGVGNSKKTNTEVVLGTGTEAIVLNKDATTSKTVIYDNLSIQNFSIKNFAGQNYISEIKITYSPN